MNNLPLYTKFNFRVNFQQIQSSFFSISTEFCPVDCDWSKEMMCGGEWDPKTGDQVTPDFCIANKVGDCANFCPVKCGENDMLCPGKEGPDGCKMPDFCNHGSRYLDSFSGN